MEYEKDSQGRFLKAGIIVWTIDPEDNPRFLIRHNRPFGGYEDEWTISFGNVGINEVEENTALRESREEFGFGKADNIQNLNYEIEFTDKKGKTVIKFFAIKLCVKCCSLRRTRIKVPKCIGLFILFSKII